MKGFRFALVAGLMITGTQALADGFRHGYRFDYGRSRYGGTMTLREIGPPDDGVRRLAIEAGPNDCGDLRDPPFIQVLNPEPGQASCVVMREPAEPR